jgi:hypothetical protein
MTAAVRGSTFEVRRTPERRTTTAGRTPNDE